MTVPPAGAPLAPVGDNRHPTERAMIDAIANTMTLHHPEKGRAVVDLSQVAEYKAAGYSEKSPEQKPEGKPEGKPDKKASK